MSTALGPILIMAGYCVVHLLEHTINAHFHYGEETHHGEFVSAHTGYSVLAGSVCMRCSTASPSARASWSRTGWAG